MGARCGAGYPAWSAAGYLVMALARRWLDPARDCDSDGWYQDSIHETSMAKLDAEAPTEPEEFRRYCVVHAGDAAGMNEAQLRQIRKFIADAARIGKGVWCSH